MTTECTDCGQLPVVDALPVLTDGRAVCGQCRTGYVACADCNADTASGEVQTINDRTVCAECAESYAACGHCDGLSPVDDMSTSNEGDFICEGCAERYYVHSEPMESLILSSRAVRLADTDEHVTMNWARNNCAYGSDGEWYANEDNMPYDDDDSEGEYGILMDYSTDVLDHCAYDTRAVRNGALVFGVELEMEPRDHSSQSAVASALGGKVCKRYILKSDGSLNRGVELVTVPLTLDAHKRQFDWAGTLAPVVSIAKSGAGTTSCGMHVHINKAALTALQIGKILVFLNSSKMSRYITAIAQRESNSYCERDSTKKLTDGTKRSASRYDMANVGSKTVELRLFRGNLRWQRVVKNLEFCHALVTYTGECSLADVDRWPVFAAWLMARRGQYPELVKFLAGQKVEGFTNAIRPRGDGSTVEVIACA